MGRIAHRGWSFPSPAILHGKASGGGGGGTAASAFITRAQGVGTYDSTHQTAITTFINGLITDGLLNSDGTSSIFDVLCVFAAPLQGQGLLNVIANGLYDGVAHGTPTFTADSGFTGVDGSSTVYIDTGFNPESGTPNYATNAAHMGVWLDDVTAATTGGNDCGCTFGNLAAINIRYNDGHCYMRANDIAAAVSPDPTFNKGLWMWNRSGASAVQYYNNTTQIGTATTTAGAPANETFFTLNCSQSGAATSGSGRKQMAFSCGGSMTSTQIGNFRSRLDTYLTTIAGIAY